MFKVLFEDDSLLVINKPAGLVVTSSETQHFDYIQHELSPDYTQGKAVPTIEDILKSKHKIAVERGGIVHRLDKDTSGVLVAAKTKQVLEDLQKQFKERTVKKEYIALVHGWVKEGGTVVASIGRNPANREKFMVTKNNMEGREAVTEYEPIKLLVMGSEFMDKIFADYSKIQMKKLRTMNYERYTLLRCYPLTGRTHQIRVHLKHIGHPVVGDEKYAGRKISRVDRRWCKRQFLHAERLKISHPKTGKEMILESPLAEDLAEALTVLEKVNS